MPDFEKNEFKFPDETKSEEKLDIEVPAEEDDKLEIEIEDDTPAKDRNREPAPKELVEELEQDELEDYSEKVKIKLKQLKRVWHDERRAKEAVERERQEAFTIAQKLLEENKALKSRTVEYGKEAADRELAEARQQYKEAYEAGDSERLIEAQEKLTEAKFRLQRQAVEESTLQESEVDVQMQQPQQVRDPKVLAWQERNPWFGQDEEMTSLALGLHEKLKRSGVSVGSDEYYERIDLTMKKRFPENFEDVQEEKTVESRTTKPSNVVAPATRTTGSKKIKLSTSQMATIKKLGITPEQYVREVLKMEAR
jgi:hypothetical protein